MSATRAIRIEWRGLPGELALPWGARAVVVFAHGSGSSRFSRVAGPWRLP